MSIKFAAMAMFLFAVLSFSSATATAAITTSTYHPCGEDCSDENCSRVNSSVCVWGGAAAFQSSVEKFRDLHDIKPSRELLLATLVKETGDHLLQHQVRVNGRSYSLEHLQSHSVRARSFTHTGVGVVANNPVLKAELPGGGRIVVIKDTLENPELIIIEDGPEITHLFALDPINHPSVLVKVGADDYDLEDLNSRFKYGHFNSSLAEAFSRRKLQSGDLCADDQKVIKVAIAVDSTFCKAVGGEKEADVHVRKIVGLASHIYEKNNVCLQVALAGLSIHCDPATDPYTAMDKTQSGCGDRGLLLDVAKYWGTNPVNSWARDRSTLHVFTGTRMEDAVGCAKIQSLCDPKSSYGVNYMTYTRDINLRAVLFAHELGHNAGAHHVKGPSNVMNPSIVPSTHFSFDAAQAINSYVAKKACVKFPTISPPGLKDYTSCFKSFAGGHKDGRNVVHLRAGQRVVSRSCNYDCCHQGSRVDGSNVVILNEGARVVSVGGHYQYYTSGILIPGNNNHGNAVVLERGERVVSWDGDYQRYTQGVVGLGGHKDGYPVTAILPAGVVAVAFNGVCDVDWDHKNSPPGSLKLKLAVDRIDCDGAKDREQSRANATTTTNAQATTNATTTIVVSNANMHALGPALLAITVTFSALLISSFAEI